MLHKFQAIGIHLILWTVRDNKPGIQSVENFGDRQYLEEAIAYCSHRGIKFIGHNGNPTSSQWTLSPKCYAHFYIDDSAIGCPLIYEDGKRPYVDWSKVGPMVIDAFLKQEEWKSKNFKRRKELNELI